MKRTLRFWSILSIGLVLSVGWASANTVTQVDTVQFRLVNTLSHEEIAVLPVRTLSDLLRYIPGLDLRERGAAGVQADVVMRGGTADQVKVYLNGIDLTNAQTGHYSMDLPIDLSLIERIEVVQGTAYDIGSISGAINIVTKKQLEPLAVSQDSLLTTQDSLPELQYEVIGSLMAGEYGLIAPSLAGRIQKNDWHINMSAGYNRSSGYTANIDYQIFNAYVQTGYKGFDFQAGAQMKNAGAQSFYSLHYPNQHDATRTAFASAAYQNKWGNWNFDGNVYYHTHFDRFQLFRDGEDENGAEAPDWYTANTHWTHTAGAHLVGGYSTRWGKTQVGVDVRDEYLRSSNMGEHNRVNINYFADQSIHFDDFSASLGASGIWNSQFGHNWNLGLNLGYEFYRGFSVFAHLNRAVRMPTFTDVYYASETHTPNGALKPETAYQIEIGAKYAYKHFYINGTGYYRWGQNVIDWVRHIDDEVDTPWQSVNHQRINAIGLEFAFGWQGHEYLRKLELSYAYCHLYKFNTQDLLSQYALDYIPNKVSLLIEHKIYGGLGASWCLRWQQRDGQYLDHSNHSLRQYKSVVLFDGNIYYDYKFLRASIGCQNMANQLYYDFGGILQPQHWLFGKLEFRL